MRRAALTDRFASSTDDDNLDPFLDIISNVVGILIVVAVLIAVSISAATTTVYAPLLYQAPEELVWLDEVFCIGGRVALCDGPEVCLQLEQFAKKQYGSGWEFDLNGISEAWQQWKENKEEFHGKYFRIDDFFWRESSQCAYLSLSLLQENAGDDLKKLRSEESWFRSFLSTKDPAKEGVALIVTPTGFKEFQVARDLAKSMGFHVKVRIFKKDNLLWTVYGKLPAEPEPDAGTQ